MSRILGMMGLVLLIAEFACAEPLRIILDADQTGARSSSLSIERGIRTALAEVDNRLADREVEILLKDHRGNSVRSKRHLEDYLADEQALVVFTGLHSPPLLTHREFINKQQILVLDPWAAAGPITRFPTPENWIFRLSVDDSKAGRVISHHALLRAGAKHPALLLEETGWGRSNERTMQAACQELGIETAGVFWFKWGLGVSGARILIRNLSAVGADCIFLVANAPEGKTIIREMARLPAAQRLPIYSHWGITGGDFAVEIGPEIRRRVDLTFLQTSFSFVSSPEQILGQSVLDRAARLFPEIEGPRDIEAPTGFVHAYDLTRLLIAAVNQVGLSGDIIEDRNRIRLALEQLEQPVTGLIKTYHRPFRPFDAETDPDAHEALGPEDMVMARYADDNSIYLLEAGRR